MRRHLVIGAGEVGTAVHAVLSRAHKAQIRDTEEHDTCAEVLHVCFPWSEQFVEYVQKYTVLHQADMVVVHSTVPVGTCDPYGWVHSPVRGRHPHLVEGLLNFVKHFGGSRAAGAAQIFDTAGVRVQVHERAADTEAGKIWELIQYGLAIRTQKEIHAWCENHDVDFDVVYDQFAQTYNDGYTRLGYDHFVRPVLTHMPGPIGGHCVPQAASLIDHYLGEMISGDTWSVETP